MNNQDKIKLLAQQYNNINKILIAHHVPKEDREDLLHEIFITALKSLHQLRDVEKLRSWLWKIAENSTKKYYRTTWTRNKIEVSYPDTSYNEALLQSVHLTQSDQITEVIDHLAQKEQLLSALQQLDQEERILLNLHYGLQYRLIEIAKVQGKNYSTLKSMHTRALKKLRKILEDTKEDIDF